ncbi:MAG: DNA mismatch endonuclease Vsr [Vicingaceae bacterium]|nr:DNA mismatch endonuclease Vsr [Vicingaceae bacterium]
MTGEYSHINNTANGQLVSRLLLPTQCFLFFFHRAFGFVRYISQCFIKPKELFSVTASEKKLHISVKMCKENRYVSYFCQMADVHSKAVRSYNMSQIRGKDTKPELLVRRFLFANGIRYRLYDKKLPGKPDIILKKFKTVIFVHGCFWHGHDNCKYFVVPKTRTGFWLDKIEGNKKRDEENATLLNNNGWNIIIVYECQLKKEKREATLNDILQNIQNQLQN